MLGNSYIICSDYVYDLLWCYSHFQVVIQYVYIYMKSSDAKASKCHLKFSSLMRFLSNLYI